MPAHLDPPPPHRPGQQPLVRKDAAVGVAFYRGGGRLSQIIPAGVAVSDGFRHPLASVTQFIPVEVDRGSAPGATVEERAAVMLAEGDES